MYLHEFKVGDKIRYLGYEKDYLVVSENGFYEAPSNKIAFTFQDIERANWKHYQEPAKDVSLDFWNEKRIKDIENRITSLDDRLSSIEFANENEAYRISEGD